MIATLPRVGESLYYFVMHTFFLTLNLIRVILIELSFH